MNETYLPVPVWNGSSGWWEPVDFRRGQRIVHWPERFDPALLPAPEYSTGDRVQFVRDETCAREGVIRLVLLRGGAYSLLETQEDAIRRCSLDAENITYIVTARGHDHHITAGNILGRFVSLQRLSQLFPPQE